MATSEHKYLSDFARKYYGEGAAEGVAKGKVEGKAEGKAEGARAALLTVIAARGIALTARDRERIADCVDVVLLDAWVARAAQASLADDVFGD